MKIQFEENELVATRLDGGKQNQIARVISHDMRTGLITVKFLGTGKVDEIILFDINLIRTLEYQSYWGKFGQKAINNLPTHWE